MTITHHWNIALIALLISGARTSTDPTAAEQPHHVSQRDKIGRQNERPYDMPVAPSIAKFSNFCWRSLIVIIFFTSVIAALPSLQVCSGCFDLCLDALVAFEP